MILHQQLRTQQLFLSSLTASHAGGPYLAWMNDPDVTRYTESSGRRFDRADLETFIVQCNEDPVVLLLGMFDLDDSRHVGNIKLGPLEMRHRRADVGLIVGDRSKWGRGFAKEAISAVTSYAFCELGIEKLTAGCYARNIGSARAFLGAGWHEEGCRYRHGVVDGRREDVIQIARFSDGSVPYETEHLL
ncbi:GNAT family protein [Hyphomicrobium sp.]|uniref:GNAT family N-acetyltransferase n=1 Tax=Hyphomicrobium sp. TaxID=82 RepID=UPI0025BDA3E9|nr:GNAT family protein [Hyphomicrobium sp.]MCC7250958.1 GNAT family N-acetyltransferase [Hyphomicrobium sp.]